MAEILPAEIVPDENPPASTKPKEGGEPGGGGSAESRHNWGCLSCAAFGALAASIADLGLKGDVSTIAKISSGMNSGLGWPVLPIYVVLFFIAAGVVIAWVNRISDHKAALYAGASAISVVMAIVPNDMPKSLTATAPPIKNAQAPRSFPPAAGWFIGDAQADEKSAPPALPSSIHLYVMDTGKRPVTDYTVTLTDAATNAIIGKSRYEAPEVTFNQPPGNYLLTVESPGYLSQSKMLNITTPTTLMVPVELQATNRPELVQRLFRKY